MKFFHVRKVVSLRQFSSSKKDPPGTNLVLARKTSEKLEMANFSVEDLRKFCYKPRLTASLSVGKFEALCTVGSVYKLEATNQEGKICEINREGREWSGYVRPVNESKSYNRFIQTMGTVNLFILLASADGYKSNQTIFFLL